MKTLKGNNPIEIYYQALVADYVAGHLNDNEEVRADFEKALAGNEALQKAVNDERLLRETLVSYELDNRGPDVIGAEGIESLLAQLDTLDEQPTTAEPKSNVVHALFSNRNNWFAFAGVAASMAFATVLFVGFQANTVDPDFVLLSDEKGTDKAGFDNLVNSQRVAQIWLASELPLEELSKLFDENQLTPISRAGQAWIVSSSEELSSKQLESLEAQKMFKQVRLISYDN